jgi:hypothetical protein
VDPERGCGHFGNETGRARDCHPSSDQTGGGFFNVGWRTHTRSGDLVPDCQPVHIAELAKTEFAMTADIVRLLPKIPMLPSEVPQQRICEVVSLPSRPVPFVFKVGYGDFPPDVMPKQAVPRSPKLLVQTEWAQTPMNNGIDAFYLQARKKYWVLWLRTFDDNSDPWQWHWQVIGYCKRTNVDREVAAKYLLLEYWKFTGNPDENTADDQPFDWINEEGLLSVADVRAIVRELNWQQKTSR